MKGYDEGNGYNEPNDYGEYSNSNNTPNEYSDYNNGYATPNDYSNYNNGYGTPNNYTEYNNGYAAPNNYSNYNNGYGTPNDYNNYNSGYTASDEYSDYNGYDASGENTDYNNGSDSYTNTGNTSSEYAGFESLIGAPDDFNTSSSTTIKPEANEDIEEYDALTPEEMEYERRRKAAARRRKAAAKEARRKKRLQQAIIRCSILLIIVILLLVGFIKMITGIVHHFQDGKKSSKNTEEIISTEEATTEEPVADIDEAIVAKDMPADREAAIELLTQQAATDTEMQSIIDNIAIYPDDILRYLSVNSEMKQFAINYPAKINITFDGDFSAEFTPGAVPLFLQYDEKWGYADYGKDIVALRGAGPTCLSMAYTYLKQDGSMNPIKVADFATEKGYLQENGDTAWTLITDGATQLGLGSKELASNKEDMIDALKEGNVLICSVTPGDFSKVQHFILIREYKDGFFYVNDPASEARSQVGWDYKRLNSQIAKMWVISGLATAAPDSTTNNDDATGQNNDNSGTNGTNQQGTDNSNTSGTDQQGDTNSTTNNTDQRDDTNSTTNNADQQGDTNSAGNGTD